MTDGVRKRYTAEFKLRAVAQMTGCANIAALAQQLGVRRKFLYLWRDQLQRGGAAALARGPGRPAQVPTGPGEPGKVLPPTPPVTDPRDRQLAAQQERIAALERQLGQKQEQVEFFKRAFAHVRGAAPTTTDGGVTASTPASRPGSRAKVSQD